MRLHSRLGSQVCSLTTLVSPVSPSGSGQAGRPPVPAGEVALSLRLASEQPHHARPSRQPACPATSATAPRSCELSGSRTGHTPACGLVSPPAPPACAVTDYRGLREAGAPASKCPGGKFGPTVTGCLLRACCWHLWPPLLRASTSCIASWFVVFSRVFRDKPC